MSPPVPALGVLALGVLARDEEGSIERMLRSVVRHCRPQSCRAPASCRSRSPGSRQQQLRTRIGSFQARRVSGAAVDSNKTASAMAERTRRYRRLSWKARFGKLAWIPLELYVEWLARRVAPESLDDGFWMQVASTKLEPRRLRGRW